MEQAIAIAKSLVRRVTAVTDLVSDKGRTEWHRYVLHRLRLRVQITKGRKGMIGGAIRMWGEDGALLMIEGLGVMRGCYIDRV